MCEINICDTELTLISVYTARENAIYSLQMTHTLHGSVLPHNK